MSLRELVVLGTASQVPTRYRNHNGYLLRWDGEGILFDPGEGTQRQMIRAGVTVSGIHRICITHFHGDHCLGLPGVIQRISLDEVPHPVVVHYPRSGQRFFDRLRRASIFLDKSDIRPAPIEGPGPLTTGGPYTLSTAKLEHGADAWGFRLDEPDSWTMDPARLEELGVRRRAIGDLKRDGEVDVDGRTVRIEEAATFKRGQSVAFVMDTRLCDNVYALASGVDLLICESTYLSSETAEARDHGHLTAAQAARVAQKAGARRLVLTHFSQRYPDTRRFLAEASAIHDDVVAAEDGLRIPVPARRTG